MSLVAHAQKELAIIQQRVEAEEDNQGIEMQKKMNDHLIHLITEFEKENHSGLSASYAIQMFERLATFKPIAPLTGDENEWVDHGDLHGDGSSIQQNKRRSSVFRQNNDNSTAYDINGRVFSDDGGETYWSGNGSALPITFPYSPPDEPERVLVEKEDS